MKNQAKKVKCVGGVIDWCVNCCKKSKKLVRCKWCKKRICPACKRLKCNEKKVS